jgi:prepilin-type N-terminal cleavage/methylation domain-containing protein
MIEMRTRAAPYRSIRRPAFTLVELMLVLAIICVIAAMSWPSLKRTFEFARLKNAAEQVQAAFGHARVDAMNKGVPQVFHFEPGTPQYSVDVWQDDQTSTEGDADSSASSSSTTPTTTPAAGSSPTGVTAKTGAATHQLPETIVFANDAQVQDARADALQSEGGGASLPAAGSSSPQIMFYADGTTSEAVVTVASPSGRKMSVTLRGFTGVSRLSDVFTGDTPPGIAAPGGPP